MCWQGWDNHRLAHGACRQHTASIRHCHLLQGLHQTVSRKGHVQHLGLTNRWIATAPRCRCRDTATSHPGRAPAAHASMPEAQPCPQADLAVAPVSSALTWLACTQWPLRMTLKPLSPMFATCSSSSKNLTEHSLHGLDRTEAADAASQ